MVDSFSGSEYEETARQPCQPRPASATDISSDHTGAHRCRIDPDTGNIDDIDDIAMRVVLVPMVPMAPVFATTWASGPSSLPHWRHACICLPHQTAPPRCGCAGPGCAWSATHLARILLSSRSWHSACLRGRMGSHLPGRVRFLADQPAYRRNRVRRRRRRAVAPALAHERRQLRRCAVRQAPAEGRHAQVPRRQPG